MSATPQLCKMGAAVEAMAYSLHPAPPLLPDGHAFPDTTAHPRHYGASGIFLNCIMLRVRGSCASSGREL